MSNLSPIWVCEECGGSFKEDKKIHFEHNSKKSYLSQCSNKLIPTFSRDSLVALLKERIASRKEDIKTFGAIGGFKFLQTFRSSSSSEMIEKFEVQIMELESLLTLIEGEKV